MLVSDYQVKSLPNLNIDVSLCTLEEAFTSENWIVRYSYLYLHFEF